MIWTIQELIYFNIQENFNFNSTKLFKFIWVFQFQSRTKKKNLWSNGFYNKQENILTYHSSVLIEASVFFIYKWFLIYITFGLFFREEDQITQHHNIMDTDHITQHHHIPPIIIIHIMGPHQVPPPLIHMVHHHLNHVIVVIQVDPFIQQVIICMLSVTGLSQGNIRGRY